MPLSSTAHKPDYFTLTQALKNEARRLGFQLVGVTTPDTPLHFPEYESWLNAGLHGEMAYLAHERARIRRADPCQILPDCASILVLGIRYPAAQAPAQAASTTLRGRIASYAWGVDYHTLIPPRLTALVQFLENQIGHPIPHRYYTDTGPILERDFAQRAGLGWIGKNTCLIHPRQGSYFLLAEILLSLPLEPDPPFPTDHCGSCTRCLDACPTQCILPNRTIDATQCISYLTIELKGSIPVELRPQMGPWVFGCDICQQVCPWNIRFASAATDPDFSPSAERSQPDLCAELHLTPEQFHQKFKNSPITRPKRRGYLRNIAVALGNLGDPVALPHLAHALHDPEPLVRTHAAWAIGQIGGSEARTILEQALALETDPATCAEISHALDHLSLE
ncbi:MAG: tRNA epoxyqueuosine(34) reductase QueG [Anaerolineales bacterium]